MIDKSIPLVNSVGSYYCAGESTISTAFSICDLGLIVVNAEKQVVNWNHWIADHSRISQLKAQGKTLEELFSVVEDSSLMRAVHNALDSKICSVIPHALNRHPLPLFSSQGKTISQHISIKPIHSNGLENMCLIQISDVSSVFKREKQLQRQANTLKKLADTLGEEKERAQVTLQSIADGVITTDVQGRILSMNKVAEKLTGWSIEKSVNKPVPKIFPIYLEDSRQEIANPATLCLETELVINNDQDFILVDKRGQEHAITQSAAPIMGEDNKVMGAILVFRDVTHSRKLAAQIRWQAKHDPLTGLVNRREFEIVLTQLLNDARSNQTHHSLLYIDLDQFKLVNDTCGHVAGDQLLRQLASILQLKLRNNDTLARIGGDEFCVLLKGCEQIVALRIANALRKEIQAFRFSWGEQIFVLGVSIGLAEIRGTEKDAAEILSAADSACYVAKDTGRNRVHIHKPDQNKQSILQMEMKWISRLQNALDENRFCLYIQRIKVISERRKEEDHYEVLIRMLDHDHKLIPPGDFIPAAERFNLMPSIDRWVIRNLFKTLASMPSYQQQTLPVFSINLSGSSLSDDFFLKDVQDLLYQSGLPPDRFCFEITETAAIAKLTKVIHFISELKNMGCFFSLDDFGSGLSSFTYLKNLPVDFLKIDGHFVKNVVRDPIDRAFVESINQIGHVMGLTTIAEFVENKTILATLHEIGIDYAQGYGIEIPKPLSELYPTERADCYGAINT